MNGRRVATESGAALLEAVMALALVAVTVTGGARLHRATVDARLAAERTVAALTVATTTAERARAGLAFEGADDATPVTPPAPLWTRRSCGPAPAPDLLDVPVRADATAGTAARLRVAVPAPTPDRLAVAVTNADGTAAAGAEVLVAGPDPRTVTVDAAGCADLGPTTTPVLVVATAADGGVGPTLLPVPAAALTATGVPTLRLAVRTAVAVDVVADGVLPDVVADGALTWWEAGGAAGTVTEPGGVALLEVGDRSVVVGTCADPRAGGSASGITVVPGVATTVVVPLGAIRVARPAVADGRRLVLRRLRPCPGTGARPTLVWDVGAGSAPLRAAVPDGTWEVVLEDASGVTLRGPVAVAVAGTGDVDPSW